MAIKALAEGGDPDHPVTSVNGKTGAVTLNANDVGATTKAYVDEKVNNISFPVTSVNNKTGSVSLKASDVGAATQAYVNSKVNDVTPLTITLTEDHNNGTYTSNTEYVDIKDAYDAGVPINISVNGNGRLPLMNAEFSGDSAGFTFGYTQVRTDGETIVTRSVHYLHTADVDEWEDSDLESQPMTLNGGVMSGDINMATHGITNVGKIHVDGQAPLFLGSTIEPAGTAGVRLTGTTAGDAAFVKADTQSTYRPVLVGMPTIDNHAATKAYVDAEVVGIFSYDDATQTLSITI